MKSLLKKYSLNGADLSVFLVVLFLGIINLPYPLGDDQSLFITGAQGMTEGKVLYRDFWDFKPPGIYYFFFTAGSLFGFNEVGIHLLELICWLIFSVVLISGLKSAAVFQNDFIATLSPLFTAGVYYSLCTVWSLTQVEALINVFLFITLLLAVKSLKSEKKKSLLIFFSGLTGGIILVFKLMFLPIIGVFWCSIFVSLLFKEKEKVSVILKRYLYPLSAGFLLPLILLFLYFLSMDLLETVYKTFFVYPPRLITEIPAGGYNKLYNLFLWYADRFYPMLAISLLGVIVALRLRRNLILLNMIFWLILGVLIIIATRTSWWDYHLQLLTVPVGILFLAAADFLVSGIKNYEAVNSWKGKLIFIVIIAIMFLPALRSSYAKSRFFMNYVTAETAEAKKKVIAGLDARENDYPYVYRNLDVITDSGSAEGEIFVAGLPLFYYLSGRSQAVSINGWVLDLLLPELWNQLNTELTDKKPVYIFIDSGYMSLLPDLSPETIKFIKEEYSIVSYSKDGIWFILKDKVKSRDFGNK